MTTTDGKNGVTLASIYELQMEHGRALGQLEGHVLRIDARVETFDRNLEQIRSTQVDQGIVNGQRLTTLEQACLSHQKDSHRRDVKISDLYRSIEKVEDTGVHHIAEEQAKEADIKARVATMKFIGALVVAIFSITSMALAIWKAF